MRIYPELIVLKSAYAFAVLVPVTAFLWINELCDLKPSKVRDALIVVPGLLFFGLSYVNGYVIESLNSLTFAGFDGTNGPLFPYYSLFIFVYVILFISVLIRRSRNTSGLQNQQVKYVLLGVSTFSIIHSPKNLLRVS